MRNQRNNGAERYITFCSIIVGIGALVILAGWQFNVETLKSILPRYISMKVNTAIGFFFLASALWPLRKREQSRTGVRIVLILSVLVVRPIEILMGFLTPLLRHSSGNTPRNFLEFQFPFRARFLE